MRFDRLSVRPGTWTRYRDSIACMYFEHLVQDTVAKLLNQVRERLVKKAHSAGLKLRQSYAGASPRRLLKLKIYAHARQMKRMKGEMKKLRTKLGRVVRDV